MVTRDEMKAALAGWARASGCRLVVLFGSGAVGETARLSDIDLALSLSELPGPKRRLAMIGEVEGLTGGRRADGRLPA